MGKKKSASQGANQKQEPSFEEALGELEDVVGQLEQGNLALDETLSTYEKGVRLLKVCHRHLGTAERKVQVLMAQDENEDHLEPFDDAATAEKADQSSPRRSSSKKKKSAAPKKEPIDQFTSEEPDSTYPRRYEDDDDQIMLF